jgi:hypothetical protein
MPVRVGQGDKISNIQQAEHIHRHHPFKVEVILVYLQYDQKFGAGDSQEDRSTVSVESEVTLRVKQTFEIAIYLVPEDNCQECTHFNGIIKGYAV